MVNRRCPGTPNALRGIYQEEYLVVFYGRGVFYHYFYDCAAHFRFDRRRFIRRFRHRIGRRALCSFRGRFHRSDLVRIREIVTYKNYKRFEADVRITSTEEIPEEDEKDE